MKSYVMQFGTGDPRQFTGLRPTLLFFTTDAGATISPPGVSEVLTGSGLYYFNWGTTTAMSFLADAATTSPGTSGRYVAGSIDPADRADEYGNTLTAIGTSQIAQGVSLGALGTTILAAETQQGLTIVAMGNSQLAFGFSSIALGTTTLAAELAQGQTMQAIGLTLTALGITNIAISTSLSATSVTIVVSIAGIGTVGSTYGSVGSDPIDLFGYMKRIQENLEGNSTFTKLSGAWQITTRGSSTVLANKSVINTSSTVTKS